MSSFPTRVIRSFFGPMKHKDDRPVERPENEFGAEHLDRLLAQSCGMNQVIQRAVLAAEWNAGQSDFDIRYQGQTWNPERSIAHPVIARSATGVYTWTFAESYADMDGNDINPSILMPRISTAKVLTAFSDRVESDAWRDASDSKIIHIRIWRESTGAAEDAPFWVEVL